MASIVIATDFSSHSRRGFDAGVRLALDLHADVVLVHAFAGPGPSVGVAGGNVQRDILEHVEKQEMEDVETLTTQWAEDARARGLSVEVVAKETDPVRLILGAVDEFDAQMVVLGSHGRSGVLRLLAGSVAEAVLRKSRVPVVVVPPVRSD